MSEPAQSDQSPFERFEELARKIVRVPKKEVDEKEKERKAAKDKGS